MIGNFSLPRLQIPDAQKECEKVVSPGFTSPKVNTLEYRPVLITIDEKFGRCMALELHRRLSSPIDEQERIGEQDEDLVQVLRVCYSLEANQALVMEAEPLEEHEDLSHLIKQSFQRCAISRSFYLSSLNAFNLLLRRIQDPKARKHVYEQLLKMLLLRASTDGNGLSTTTSCSDFVIYKTLVCRGTEDVWSEIRKATGKSLGQLCSILSLSCTGVIYESLLETLGGYNWGDCNANWKPLHGALFAINCILRNIKKEEVASGGESIRYVMGPHHSFNTLPRYILTSVPSILDCLCHQQLSVREVAVELLTAILKLGDRSPLLDIFDTLVASLSRRSSVTASLEADQQKAQPEACEIDGMLCLAHRLLDLLPADYILQRWQRLSSALLPCLMDSASTVRQNASSVLRTMAKKSTHLTILTLCALCSSGEKLFALTDEQSWQGIEGTFLCYEDILHDLLLDKLQSLSSGGTAMMDSLMTNNISRDVSLQEATLSSDRNERPDKDFNQILRSIMEQTERAMGQNRFEVRRMAFQVCDALSPVVYWTNISEGTMLLENLMGDPSSASVGFACEFAKAAVKHAQHIVEIYVDAGVNKTNLKIYGLYRWGGRVDGIGTSEFTEACAAAITLAAGSPNIVPLTFAANMQAWVGSAIPVMQDVAVKLKAQGKIHPNVVELLILLRVFYLSFLINNDTLKSLEPSDLQVVIWSIMWIHNMAYQKPSEDQEDYCYCLRLVLEQCTLDNNIWARRPVLALPEFSPSSPRYSQASDERIAFLQDRILSFNLLYHLPNFCSTVRLVQGLQLIPFLTKWIFLRDDQRWLSARSGEVGGRLISALAACLRPTFSRSVSFQPLSRKTQASKAYVDSIFQDYHPLPSFDDDLPVQRKQLLMSCQLCIRCLCGFINKSNGVFDPITMKKILAIFFMINAIIPDLQFLPDMLSSICMYANKWYGRELFRPMDKGELNNRSIHEDTEGDEDDWDSWDDECDNSQANSQEETVTLLREFLLMDCFIYQQDVTEPCDLTILENDIVTLASENVTDWWRVPYGSLRQWTFSANLSLLSDVDRAIIEEAIKGRSLHGDSDPATASANWEC